MELVKLHPSKVSPENVVTAVRLNERGTPTVPATTFDEVMFILCRGGDQGLSNRHSRGCRQTRNDGKVDPTARVWLHT